MKHILCLQSQLNRLSVPILNVMCTTFPKITVYTVKEKHLVVADNQCQKKFNPRDREDTCINFSTHFIPFRKHANTT